MEQTTADKRSASTAEIYARAEELLSAKNFDKALEVLDAAFEENAEDPVALALAGNIYAAAGDVQQATGYYGLAVQTAPDNIDYKKKFISIAGNLAFAHYNPVIEKILCLCLETPEIDCSRAQVLWYTLVRSHPQFPPLMQAALENPERPFEKATDPSFLMQPIFLTGIKRIVVCNEEFEKFMTALRRFLLEQAESPPLTLIEAVAQYCFNTDYIFNRTDAEEKAVENLRHLLENDPAARQDPVKTGLYACYEPFYKLKAAKDMACLPALHRQREEYFDLQARAAKIPSLTDVTDAVSRKVREQYEEFPYPRWRELPGHAAAETIDNHPLDKAGLQILIAGCGTGQEPLFFAQSCPKASILAIDLSRTSLAYASKKAEEMGIKNVEFRHADILQSGSLDRTFDCISSMGVLHHMHEPIEGWKALVKLLKPGGLMRIGLYSALARRSVIAAREMIRAGNYPNTPAGMRRFRQDSKRLLGDRLRDKVFDALDYYHLNMYRDLLFHVQEHQFTLPQIEENLAELKLEFLEMLLPNPPALADNTLDNWQKAEEANPDMFAGMYKFWCRKKT